MRTSFLITIVAGVIVLRATEKFSEEPSYDERDKFIALMASYTTFLVATISMALLVIIEIISGLLGLNAVCEWSNSIAIRFAPYIAFMFVVYALSWVILRIKYS